jgi:hypothetical protein
MLVDGCQEHYAIIGHLAPVPSGRWQAEEGQMEPKAGGWVTFKAREPAPSPVRQTTSELTLANRWDHILARSGVNRAGHRVEPGLYALGNPTAGSPVFVTANYTLSFDALRAALDGMAAHIMVLDTKGINVWCAAGKGTFGTGELLKQIEETGLRDRVSHRRLILPQLGAPGVAAHEVSQYSGFEVEYGPVRAADLPEYLRIGRATPEMRQVRFGFLDRAVLIPVELRLLPLFLAAIVIVHWTGVLASLNYVLAALAAYLAGTLLFPLLLPWLPTRDLTAKGFFLGVAVALPFAWARHAAAAGEPGWRQVAGSLAYLLTWPALTAYLALNFTGSTTFTSRSGVRNEIFAYVPILAVLFALGVVLTVVLAVT